MRIVTKILWWNSSKNEKDAVLKKGKTELNRQNEQKKRFEYQNNYVK